jgi:CRP-like cAMP-binding protein
MPECRKIRHDVGATLLQLPMFSELSAEHIAPIAAETRERSLARGEILFQRRDLLTGFYVILSGQIKLAFASAQGNEKVVEVLGPLQSFGEAVMLMERPCPVFAQAVVPTCVLHIPKMRVLELLRSDASFAQSMLAGMAMRLHSLIQDVESYSLRSSTQRVIGYLLQNSILDEIGVIEFVLPTSKQVIASRLNLTPETLSRIFHELSERKLIEVHGRSVMINDMAKLREFDQ